VNLKLSRNLRKKLKQGHPWVYKEALADCPKVSKACFATLKDAKGEICKGVYDPTSALAFRSLDLKSDSKSDVKKVLKNALRLRRPLKKMGTTAYRWVAGEGDGLSGLIVDVYDGVAVVQCDGEGMESFWCGLNIGEVLHEADPTLKSIVLKLRSRKNKLQLVSGAPLESPVIRFTENNVLFETDLEKAQKTGFFLDQRDNRKYIESISEGKKVWNVFSYTGGFSVYAGLGGAKKVYSVDVSQGAIDQAEVNWKINSLDANLHEGVCVDAFEYLNGERLKADMMIVDPPSMTSSQTSKAKALEKYKNLFASAAKHVVPGGDLILSSCSSQISFEDFGAVASEALSQASKKGRVLRVSGQGIDHPYPHACEEMRYLKFMHLVLD